MFKLSRDPSLRLRVTDFSHDKTIKQLGFALFALLAVNHGKDRVTGMAIDGARFRQTMGHFASGVTVVTTAYEGRPYGVTVSSFASLSLQPPLVLVCLDKNTNSHNTIIQAKGFVVNILAAGQEHLSRCFASAIEDRFRGVAWRTSMLGYPVLEGALTVIDCRLHDTLPGGDHTIFVGEVADTQVREGKPLLYYRGGYHELR